MEIRPGQYLLFRVARQDFAMEAAHVRGIVPALELIPSEFPQGPHHPQGPQWTCGFVTFQGVLVSVVDLRGKLGIAHGTQGRTPCIVVVETPADSGLRLIGFVADRVSDIVKLRLIDFRNGTVRTSGRPRRVLDPRQLLSESILKANQD
jgi:chemotaxis signal transduction protein